MIKLFVLSNCLGCEKAEKFLKKNAVRYERVNLSFAKLQEIDLVLMNKLAPGGILDIVNWNSQILKDVGEDVAPIFKNMNIKELYAFLIENPEVLSYPIALDYDSGYDKKPLSLVVGFNDSAYNYFLDAEADTEFKDKYYVNVSSSYIFNACCFYDEVKNDGPNILINNFKKDEQQ
ncbi:MAG: hypothetical protein HUJ42_02675 [Malacoplasma sp.]|nr:hypothetical protein [Malacoplasma sp.]